MKRKLDIIINKKRVRDQVSVVLNNNNKKKTLVSKK